jgi:drug/metabolite transporter (DMT)-like permease
LPATTERPGLGIALRVAAMACMAGVAALVKASSEAGVPVLEIIFFRNAAAFVPILAYIGTTTGFSVLKTRNPVGHLRRAGAGLTGMICGFSSVSMMPLVEWTAISFAAPLFMTALSPLLLKERVGLHRWGAVVVGFMGVLIMVDPNPAHFAPVGTALALAGALGSAGAMISVRLMAATEPGPAIAFYFTVAGALLGLASLPFGWVIPDGGTLALLCLTGVLGGVGQLLLTEALKRAPLTVIAPFDYTQLVWASLIGLIVWQESPRVATLLGAAVVAAGGLYILYREVGRFRRR